MAIRFFRCLGFRLVSVVALVVATGVVPTALAQNKVEHAADPSTGILVGEMSPMGRLAYLAATGRLDRALAKARLRAQRAAGQAPRSGIPDDDDEEDGPAGGQAEMSIAVDATGTHVVVGFNDTRGFSHSPVSVSGFAFSDDGGTTFTDGGQLPTTSNGTIPSGAAVPQVFGDPDVKYVPGGAGCQFIYASIMVKGLGAGPSFTGSAQTQSIHRSTDCGHTWSGPFEVPSATNPTGVLVGGNARDAADKEFISVDPDTGRVLMSWSNFTSTTVIPGGVEISTTFSDNIMSATPPTWSSRVVLNGGASSFDTGSIPRFAGNGSLNAYVVWNRGSTTLTPNGGARLGNIGFSRSTDNGATWSAAVNLTTDFFPMDHVLGNDRINSFPGLAVDTSAGANAGNIYVVYSNNTTKDGGDIVFQRSTNEGVIFSPPVLLNSRPGTDRPQWFPYVAVDSTTGRVSVVYYDQGVAPSGDVAETTWVYSDDGGTTWSKPSPLTERPFHAGYGNDTGQPNLGDYIGATAQAGTLYATWAGTPPIAGFADGQPDLSFPFPDFYVVKATAAKAALSLGSVTLADSGGNGFVNSGEGVRFQLPLKNFVTNPLSAASYTGVSATLSTTTPGVTIPTATSAYADIAPGSTVTNSADFVVQIAPSFVPGTKIDFSLAVSTGQGSTTLLFTQNTGTPLTTIIFSENFNSTAVGSLPAGWAAISVGGANVPWTTSNTFCGTSSNGLFHVNDGSGTLFKRAATPNIVIPGTGDYVTVDFDICYDTEDDPDFNVLAYDGATLRITDFTAGRVARAALVEAFAEQLTTGSTAHFPKHLPRNSNASYFQDMSVWSGDSGGMRHVNMRLPGMAGSTVQLRWDYTQDATATCANVRPGHSCGVLIDNVVAQSVKSVNGSAISVYRSSEATFYSRFSNNAGFADIAIPYGASGDVPLVGDWNGDGTTTIGVYRASDGTFYLRNANTVGFGDLIIPYGAAGDIPLVGDWNGDGVTTIGVYRPSDHTFYLRNTNSIGFPDLIIPYGTTGDIPVVGDWTGAGVTTIGVYRPSDNRFYLRTSNTYGFADIVIPYGAPGDVPVVGDWTGDGVTKISVYRPSENIFHLRFSNTSGFADRSIPYGTASDNPLAGPFK